tara:strand:+ start:974 stop:3280 length:2307 start_codon:yes stop_codon:yes gene_type:complete
VNPERTRLLEEIADLLTASKAKPAELLQQLWAYQSTNCPALSAHCSAYDLQPGTPVELENMVPVHTSTFRHGDLTCFDPSKINPVREFRSSGTSGSKRSRHRLRSLELYELSVCQAFKRFVPEVEPGSHRILSLLPDTTIWPDSSLVHMFDTLMLELAPRNHLHVGLPDGTIDIARLQKELTASDSEPTLVLGTALSHIWLHEHGFSAALSKESLVLETGGAKGTGREFSRDELLTRIHQTWHVDPQRVITEYGMAELGSQAYGRSEDRERVLLRFPSWVHVDVVDPDTGISQKTGTPGLLQIFDPVNLDTCSFIRTSDLAILHENRSFELLGRAAEAESRGCSLRVAEEQDAASPSPAPTKPKVTASNPVSTSKRIGAIAETWQRLADDGNQISQDIANQMGLSKPTVREALQREANRWTEQRIFELFAREISAFEAGRIRPRPVSKSLVITASTVPFVGLESVSAAILAGAQVVVRPSSRNPLDIQMFIERLESVSIDLAQQIEVLPPSTSEATLSERIRSMDTVVVHGGHEVVQQIRQSASANTRIVVYGPRWSLAALGPLDANKPELLAGLAVDILLHDSLGCMSPRVLLVDGDQRDAKFVSTVLGEALLSATKLYPPHNDLIRRPLGAGLVDQVIGELAREPRGVTAIQTWGSAHVVMLGPPTEDCPGLFSTPPAIRRGILVAAIDFRSDSDSWLYNPADEISTVGLGPSLRGGSSGSRLTSWAEEHGATRITEVGRMQRPPAGWPHDGQPVLLPFIKLVTPG